MGTTSEKSENNTDVTEKDKVFYDPMAVTWMDKYSSTLDKIWANLPKNIRPIIVGLAVFTFGATIRGEWLFIFVHLAKYLGYNTGEASGNETFSLKELSLESLYLKDLQYYWLSATGVSYGSYFTIGGFLHWYYYVRQRDKAEEWKCQPHKWISPELERHEILLGSLSLFVVSSISSVVSCYISNGGWSSIYYQFDEYTWIWWFLQWPVIFILQDYGTYWSHRIYHTPFLYKNFHKLHHKYKQPTAFSVTAIHPVEIVNVQVILMLPFFLIPVHFVPISVILLYTYYFGIIDHSGINFKAYWWQPWQPDAIFHDNHHQYFHVNFGFNCAFWDKLHGTYRKKDRIYHEDVYYGQGKAIHEATEEELKKDLEERDSENPLAHRNNVMEFRLTEEDLKKHS